MAVINRNTLVLTGVSVARDVVTGTMGNGLISASGRPTTSLFTTRHPSQRYPQAEQVPGPAAWHFGPTRAVAMAPVGKTLPWRPSPLLERVLRISRYPRPGVEARKQAKANQARLTPAGWALAASRRG